MLDQQQEDLSLLSIYPPHRDLGAETVRALNLSHMRVDDSYAPEQFDAREYLGATALPVSRGVARMISATAIERLLLHSN